MARKNQSLNTDQQAVLAVIEADLTSYLSRDKQAWESNWVKDDRFQSVMECGTLQVANGYSAFRDNIFEAMDAAPEPIQAAVSRENIRISVSGDTAWATFDQIVSDTRNALAPPNYSHNLRVLERHGTSWKIVFHGVWAQPLRDIETPAIEVGRDCSVVWMNQNAVEKIVSFQGLAVSHGTLRAARPSWDVGLRETVERAHTLTSFGKYNLAVADGGGTLTFPVLLGEDEDGAMLVCWVRVADSRVYILFGETPDLAKQIEIASIIFGLSETQTQIVRSIASGLDLTEISNTLGISKNTARTHLRRVFDKVGVRSQLDLLCKLVSFSV